MTACEAGSAIMAYFYFDFKDLRKQTCFHLYPSFPLAPVFAVIFSTMFTRLTKMVLANPVTTL